MIDYDDTEVSYRLQEIDCVVRQMQSDWEEITVESVARGGAQLLWQRRYGSIGLDTRIMRLLSAAV